MLSTPALPIFLLLISSFASAALRSGDGISTPSCFEIAEGSKLYLEGSSNINTFSCDCEGMDRLPPLYLDMQLEENKQQASFDRAQLNIRTRTLDCGHRGINRDLYESLKTEEHPYIRLQLENVRWDKPMPAGLQEWQCVTAKARLTVAGVERAINMKVRATRTQTGQYRFVAQHRILMTDYGVEPPTALLGTIKVNNAIDINFDLLVRAE